MEFNELLEEATVKLRSKSLLRKPQGTALVAGDIHGDITSLEQSISLREELDLDYLILLGDYVDRGDHQLEVVKRIAEQVISDNKFIPLRGNHEDFLVCSRYGFTSILDRKGLEIAPFMKMFAELPNAVQSASMLMMHGGLPVKENFMMEEIKKFDRKQIVEGQLQKELLWNDPINDGVNEHLDRLPSRRGPEIWQFGSPITKKVLESNNAELNIRAHIAFPSGAEWIQEKTILSLFTSQSGPYRNHTPKVASLDLSDPESIEIYEPKQ